MTSCAALTAAKGDNMPCVRITCPQFVLALHFVLRLNAGCNLNFHVIIFRTSGLCKCIRKRSQAILRCPHPCPGRSRRCLAPQPVHIQHHRPLRRTQRRQPPRIHPRRSAARHCRHATPRAAHCRAAISDMRRIKACGVARQPRSVLLNANLAADPTIDPTIDPSINLALAYRA